MRWLRRSLADLNDLVASIDGEISHLGLFTGRPIYLDFVHTSGFPDAKVNPLAATRKVPTTGLHDASLPLIAYP